MSKVEWVLLMVLAAVVVYYANWLKNHLPAGAAGPQTLGASGNALSRVALPSPSDPQYAAEAANNPVGAAASGYLDSAASATGYLGSSASLLDKAKVFGTYLTLGDVSAEINSLTSATADPSQE